MRYGERTGFFETQRMKIRQEVAEIEDEDKREIKRQELESQFKIEDMIDNEQYKYVYEKSGVKEEDDRYREAMEQRSPEKVGFKETFDRNQDFMYRLRARELKGETMGGKETLAFKKIRKEAYDHKEFQENVKQRRAFVEFTDEIYDERY